MFIFFQFDGEGQGDMEETIKEVMKIINHVVLVCSIQLQLQILL